MKVNTSHLLRSSVMRLDSMERGAKEGDIKAEIEKDLRERVVRLGRAYDPSALEWQVWLDEGEADAAVYWLDKA